LERLVRFGRASGGSNGDSALFAYDQVACLDVQPRCAPAAALDRAVTVVDPIDGITSRLDRRRPLADASECCPMGPSAHSA
jgi:hypothetical protein